ncbi:MAG: HI0074 family nucleotidyltransferase substrate-binding subunit [Pseudomonadota bacterium]|nr:HI0074 family nucleotidyltransferase substrate-binding subunit [Pseudomonadota bacterium]
MVLDVTNLERALTRLEKNLAQLNGTDKSGNPDMYDSLRAGAIKHFEIVYELSWKMIRKWLLMYRKSDNGEEIITKRDFMRIAADNGLILSPDSWDDYREARNASSHTYNETGSDRIVLKACDLVRDARYLIGRLRQES